jgi:hypothetical protein
LSFRTTTWPYCPTTIAGRTFRKRVMKAALSFMMAFVV